MSEPDELYTLRAKYWLGHYALALDEGRSAARRPLPTHLKAEREEFVRRCHLALGQYDPVVADPQSGSVALRALAIHALFLGTPPEKRTGGAILTTLKQLLASPEAQGNTSVQLTACHVYLAAGQVKEALECVHLGLTMEHLALCVQIYLRIDRPDLAHESLGLLKQADEDSILAQLASAHVAIAAGRSAAGGDAVHLLAGLSEQYGPSRTLLNVTAAAHMVAGNYAAAEGHLQAAVQEFGGEDDADTLVNLVVCAQYLGKGKGPEAARYLEKLKASCKEHPFVQGLLQVEGAFEREAAKYLTA